YVVSDENMPYYDDPLNWEQLVARPELAVVSDALSTEKSLRKVIQFAPQVAAQAQQQAILAILVALAAIVAYIWIRFGQMQFGLAAIVALVHDLSVTLGMVALAHFVFDSPIGRALGLMDFKIDLPMIAAFLTIIGYSLNDTIVVFDRIRENRGKLTKLTPNMINTSINQTLSRTVLTSLTTFMAVFVMYVFGGPGIHGFSFALMVGVVVGTYSSLGIAAPLLHRPVVLHMVVYVLVALGLFAGLAMVAADRQTLLLIGGGLIAAALIWVIRLETRAARRTMVLAPSRA
ncbi:MAG: protein translocase subunit SecF, partial [Planctomycetes bacterium]|nr:protein translocase subunit SecF [Planctomycetota bacterium]